MFDKMFASLFLLKLNALDAIERDEDGATMVEYGLIVVAIAVAVAAAAFLLGGRIVALFDSITFP